MPRLGSTPRRIDALWCSFGLRARNSDHSFRTPVWSESPTNNQCTLAPTRTTNRQAANDREPGIVLTTHRHAGDEPEPARAPGRKPGRHRPPAALPPPPPRATTHTPPAWETQPHALSNRESPMNRKQGEPFENETKHGVTQTQQARLPRTAWEARSRAVISGSMNDGRLCAGSHRRSSRHVVPDSPKRPAA